MNQRAASLVISTLLCRSVGEDEEWWEQSKMVSWTSDGKCLVSGLRHESSDSSRKDFPMHGNLFLHPAGASLLAGQCCLGHQAAKYKLWESGRPLNACACVFGNLYEENDILQVSVNLKNVWITIKSICSHSLCCFHTGYDQKWHPKLSSQSTVGQTP